MKDINLVRTAQDLERKYNLSSIGTLKKNYELQKEGLNKVENELSTFAKITTKEIEDLKNQVDGNITTWFSSGLPTLENYPANEWLTDEEKNNHLGDLYYDQDTGYSYRFIQKDGVYSWLKIVDNDVAEALAIANSAKDTADRKRQVFIVEPMPPYDVGDLWIRDEEIYRCQTSKPSGESFEENDWIKATRYTDDTVANQVGNNLTILSGTVTEIRQDVDNLNTKMTNTTELVDNQGTKIGILEEKTSETSQTVEGISSTISTISSDVENLETISNNNYIETNEKFANLNATVNGVSIQIAEQQKSYENINGQLVELDGSLNDMKYNFSTDGLRIGNSTDSDNALFDNTGVKVYNYETLNAIFNHKGSGIDKLIVTTSAQLGYLKIVKGTKNGKKVTKFYHLENLIESLEDLL